MRAPFKIFRDLRLARNPGPRQYFIVRGDDGGEPPGYFPEPVDHPHATFRVFKGIINGIERKEGAWIRDLGNAFHGGQLPPLMEFRRRDSCGAHLSDRLLQGAFHGLNLLNVFLHGGNLLFR